ncbi:MAG: hypothetical protein U1A07_21905, partial [Phenylobacterium sp.]|nr:hypothetical protein [Phenylobacterium sp.]
AQWFGGGPATATLQIPTKSIEDHSQDLGQVIAGHRRQETTDLDTLTNFGRVQAPAEMDGESHP